MYPTQSSGMSMWTNAGYSNFNGGTLSLRKAFRAGVLVRLQLHAVALAATTAARPRPGGGIGGGIMLNPYDFDAFYGDSDFDIRHNLNSNVLVELPFGRGKKFLSNAGALTDALVGGWQLTGIFRYRSGLPTSVAYSGIWPTNFVVHHARRPDRRLRRRT